MNNICLNNYKMLFKNMKSSRLLCSFILFTGFIFSSNSLFAQQAINPSSSGTNSVPDKSISLSLTDVDGDGLNDAVFENKNIKTIISSKNGAPSLYYLKGERFEENLFPPQLLDLGYSIDQKELKAFHFDTPENYFSNKSFNIEIESQNDANVVIKATANVSLDVDDSTPDQEAISLIKRYTFSEEGYGFKIDNTVSNLKEKLITVGNDSEGAFSLSFGPGIFMDPFAPNILLGLKNNGESTQYTAAADLTGAGAKDNSFCGVGIKDQYFCVLMESNAQITIAASSSQILAPDSKKRPHIANTINCSLPKFNLGAKESRNFEFSVYSGPFIYEELEKINRTKVADFGFLNTIMLKTLRFFHSLIPNYGVAIILLTLLVRLVLYPLTLNQTKAMAKMQKIQPKLKQIQERYKDDPQKMNEEVMKLYTKNNVNPLSGCFPLLLQLPIIMALYNTFRIAVELRKASFLWMPDLSKGDPFLILPIAIAALMYYQQGKANVDPQQKQAMAFMPMFMFVITWSLPSGLLVYWFASSVLGILQQIQANHYMASMKEE